MRRSQYRLPSASKFGNKKVEIDGYVFDSQAEAARYLELKTLVQAGEILDLELHPSIELQPAFRDNRGTWQRAITYQADFAYNERDGQRVYEDTKGFKTPEFRIKAKMFRYLYPTIKLGIVEA